jgi:hypothetical protein
MPQFKRAVEPPIHQFVVFSTIDDNDYVKPKYSQCNNCGLIHKVFEISKSEIQTGREHMSSIVTIEDIKMSLDTRLVAALESNDVEVATWEEALFIIEQEQWGSYLTLNRDFEGDEIHVKTIRILGPSMFKVETEILERYAKENIV